MTKEIKLENIKRYQEKYLKSEKNINIQQCILKHGLENACFNNKVQEKYKYSFNVQIPEIKIYDQKNGYECNIYAFLRMIKSIMKKDNSISTKNLDLSATYIDFYDKLEKVNTFYNELLKEEQITLELINQLANRYIGAFGTFNFCKKIINKYGLVPSKFMPDVTYKYNANLMIELLTNKVKTDATILIDKNKEERENLKETLIIETYNFLSKILGNPPTIIEYKKQKLNPNEFRWKYLKTDLEEYVTLTMYDKKTLYDSYSFIPSIYLKDDEKILTSDENKIKDAVVKQLKDGVGVWFSSEESTTLDYNSNILDDNVFNYKEILNIRDVPNKHKLQLNLINYDHAMCITGALVKNKKVKQFKVDNSFGHHGKHKGHLIMTDSFFKNCVITLIINKKYLN